jgi:hypothetical protein
MSANGFEYGFVFMAFLPAAVWRHFHWQAMNRPGAFDFLFERAGRKGERMER